MIGVHRRDGDQPEGFDESSGAARLYWITPEISFGRARRLPGERFEALAALPVRVASIVALSAGRSGWRYHISAMMLLIFWARTDNSPPANAPLLLVLREQPASFQPNAQAIAGSAPE
jgi:hypothetical protein